MISVLAHASHWLAQAIYLAPLVLLVGILVVTQVRDRRARRQPESAAMTNAGAPNSSEDRPVP
ncbi:MAG: hypothetical protein M3P40_13030 [Actinomycetota bacterium]|nr:hypothetical protein [Actinomycetota bacterium]